MGELKKRLDIKGRTFGKLTVVDFAYTNKHKKSMWLCKCECGKEVVVLGAHLLDGHTQSCGCFKKEASALRLRTHGKKKTRIYNTWLQMKARCTNPKARDFENYGGRGITICAEWRNDFQTFYDWAMANGYADNLTIDRINVNGNYEPDNCRWVSIQEQQNNKRTNRRITYNGETHTLKDWAEITGINYSTLHSRFRAEKEPAVILQKGGVNYATFL